MTAPLPRKFDKRTRVGKRVSAEARDAAMSVSHLTDTVGNYDMPHILTHAKTASRSNDIAHIKRQIEHVVKHANDAAMSSKKIRKKIDLLPGVKQQNARLANARKQSYK